MVESQKITKLLRYSLQFIAVYLILRYTPQIKLDSQTSLIIALVLTSLCVIIEFLYANLINEGYEDSCNVCDIPKPQQNCRMVCDIENFDALPSSEKLGNTENIINVPITKMSADQLEIEIQKRVKQQLLMNATEKENFDKVIPLQKENIPNTFNMPSMQEMYNKQEEKANVIDNGIFDPTKPTMVNITSDKSQPAYPTGGSTMPIVPDYLTKPINPANVKNEIANREYNVERQAAVERNANTVENYNTTQTPGADSQKNRPVHYTTARDGNVINEYDYSDYDYNHLPLASGYEINNAEDLNKIMQQQGYWSLPPFIWNSPTYRNLNFVPKNERENIMPVFADGTATNWKDFYAASSFTGRQGINTSYITEKLNAGR